MLSLSYRYLSDQERNRLKKQLVEELGKAVVNPDRLETIRKMLDYMFPLYSKIDERPLRSLRLRWRKDAKGDQKICDPALISAYFRYKLPDELFSTRELTAFLRRFGEAPSPEKKNGEFLSLFESMKKGDPRRDNFLNKLSDDVPKMSLASATALLPICMRAAHSYAYDMGFVGLGEAGHVLRIVIRVALRVPVAKRANLLSRPSKTLPMTQWHCASRRPYPDREAILTLAFHSRTTLVS